MYIGDLEKRVPGSIFARGEDYYERGLVFLDSYEDELYTFTVQGTHEYTVEIQMEGDEVVSWSCDCPYDRSMCKHVVACLLYIMNDSACEGKGGSGGSQIEDLQEDELAFLCFIAYIGSPVKNQVSRLPLVCGLNKISATAQRNLLKNLYRTSWLIKENASPYPWQNEYQYRVSPSRVFPLLHELLYNRKGWIPQFNLVQHRSTEGVVMTYVAQYLKENQPPFEKLTFSGWTGPEMSEYFCEVMYAAIAMDSGKGLLKYLPPMVTSRLISLKLREYAQSGDICALEYAKKLFDCCNEPVKSMPEQYARLRLYWFYYKGELLSEPPVRTECYAQSFLDAALLLYKGDAQAACAEYQKGNRLVKGDAIWAKDFPNDVITLYLYTCTFALMQPVGEYHLNAIIKKSELCGDLSVNMIARLASVFLGQDIRVYERNLNYSVTSDNYLASSISALVLALGHKDVENKYPGGCTCALLQNELSSLIPGLAKPSFDFEPVISRIRIREPWEVELQKLIDIATKTSSAAKGHDGERVIYYVPRYSDSVEVRIQKPLKSGAVSRGRAVSRSAFSIGNYPMDETDVAIRNELSKDRFGNGYPCLRHVLPHCKGKNKLYSDSSTRQLVEVKVTEDVPYILTERKNGRIYFTSNITQKALIDDEDILYNWSYDRDAIVFWRVGESIRPLFKRILTLGSVPEAAEPMLETLFSGLQGQIEVRSDVRGGVQLEKIPGSATLCVRIEPDGDGYNLKAFARPLEGGSVYCQIAKEKKTIVDGNDSGRYEVTRNFNKESHNLKRIHEALGFSQYGRTIDEYGAFLLPEHLLSFLEEAEQMSEVFYIEWPRGESLSVIEPTSSTFEINAVGKGDWFELEGDIRITEDTILSVASLLDIVRSQEGRYIRLSDGQYLKLSDSIRRQLQRIDAVSQDRRGKVAVPELAMSMIADSVADVLDLEDGTILEDRRRLIREASSVDFQIPENLNAVLRPYQEEGFRWMMRLSHWKAGICLADDMGLGKTVQTIAFMLAHASEGPQMVVVPASVIGNWRAELARFAPSLRVVILNELAPSDRAEALQGIGSGGVLVLTYGVLVSDRDAITNTKWTTVVLDEAHMIKNKETKISAAVMSLSADNRIILTGTPIQNHLGELWNLFRFINPGLLGSYEHFQEKYVGKDSPASRDALKRLVTPFMLRRTKNEVVRELPDKTEIIVPVELGDDEMAVYEILRREAKHELEGGGSLSVNALAMMTKLRMASCSTSLVEPGWTGTSAKVDMFMDKLSAIVEGGNSVLVFSQFTSFLDIVCEEMKKAGFKDYLYLNGSTTIAKRQKMVTAFQNGEVPVFLISLKAGGLGLNLTGANYVIHLDPWWNPSIEQQATDRAYRIGQSQKVTVYHLISSNTIEEKILRLHSTKRQLADSILEGTSTSNKLSAEDILELIS